MSGDNAFTGLNEEHPDDAHWVFGTGFTDPLHGVDTTLPDGVDGRELAAYCIALGDDALICAQRLAQWCTQAPELEEEMALANIALDLIGQARLLYTRAGQADGTGRSEDDLAYFRDPAEFRNVRLAELPNGDFAFSVGRLLAFSAWRLAIFERLTGATDPVLAAIAAKGVKELAYHRQYAADWVVRLGDGTEESYRRMRHGLDLVTPHLKELFTPAAAEAGTEGRTGAGIAVDPATIEDEVMDILRQVAAAARLTLAVPVPAPNPPELGREGRHTEHLAPLLAELQSIARSHPAGVW